MTTLDTCPHCGTSQLGSRIPTEQRLAYGGASHYSRTLGVEIPGVYDGVLYWRCPDCGGRWHRFPPGHHLRQRAEPYVGVGIR
ncbi:MAG: hypothetical protein GEU83_12060 [Pseudonocardiaceae bacterium]|nr:hypothetical protein [Pseudonocardiaceae bacterium]